MTRAPFVLACCAVVLLGAGISAGQEDKLLHPGDELAATVKICGKPLAEEPAKVDKQGVTHRVLDYRGVSLFFKMNPKIGPEFYLDDAIRHLDPTTLSHGELIEVLPCTRVIRYRRILP
jgi:hypothetical protein